MQDASATDPRRNGLLAALPDADLDRLTDEIELVEVHPGDALYRDGEEISDVHFPLSGVASMIRISDLGMSVEVASIAREGMAGLPVFLGASRERAEAVQQLSGRNYRMSAGTFRREIGRHGALFEVMLRYTHFVLLQAAQTVLCNRLHPIAHRAARWLVTTRDQTGSDTFPLTHEFFATMLGAHRPSVTLAAGTLQEAGLIEYRRGQVTILDADRLQEASCECFGVVKRDYDALLPPL